MPMILSTDDSAFAARVRRRLTRAQIHANTTHCGGLEHLHVLQRHAQEAEAIAAELLAEQPWRTLSRNERILFGRRHHGFLSSVARDASVTPQAAGRCWYGQSPSNDVEAVITHRFSALTT